MITSSRLRPGEPHLPSARFRGGLLRSLPPSSLYPSFVPRPPDLFTAHPCGGIGRGPQPGRVRGGRGGAGRRGPGHFWLSGPLRANLRTKILDLGGFDASRTVTVRGGTPRPTGNSPESLCQGILAGTILVLYGDWAYGGTKDCNTRDPHTRGGVFADVRGMLHWICSGMFLWILGLPMAFRWNIRRHFPMDVHFRGL